MDPPAGDALPEFSLPTLNHGNLSNSDLKGRVSLLNVWASWCSYCYNEHAMLMKISSEYHVPIYGIDFQDAAEDARAYLSRYGNPYVTTGIDAYGETGNTLGVTGTPATFVIDKHGMIRFRLTGGISQGNWNRTIYPLIKQLQAEK